MFISKKNLVQFAWLGISICIFNKFLSPVCGVQIYWFALPPLRRFTFGPRAAVRGGGECSQHASRVGRSGRETEPTEKALSSAIFSSRVFFLKKCPVYGAKLIRSSPLPPLYIWAARGGEVRGNARNLQAASNGPAGRRSRRRRLSQAYSFPVELFFSKNLKIHKCLTVALRKKQLSCVSSVKKRCLVCWRFLVWTLRTKIYFFLNSFTKTKNQDFKDPRKVLNILKILNIQLTYFNFNVWKKM